MSGPAAPEHSAWTDAVRAAELFAVDPAGLAGVALRALAGPVRDRWLELLRDLLPTGAPLRRIPQHVTDGRLLGGLDLTATLQAGRPVMERGILAEADGGVVLLAMAERMAAGMAARLAAVLDRREVRLERDGFALCHPARIGMVTLDEGMSEEERTPPALLDRLAFVVDLGGIAVREADGGWGCRAEEVAVARLRLPEVRVGDGMVEALCSAAVALRIASIRAPMLALTAARAAAALAGRNEVAEEDLALAARLVLAPRATMLPAAKDETEAQENEPPQPNEAPADDDGRGADRPLDDVVLAAAQAAIPEGLLARLRVAEALRAQGAGRAGAARQGVARGRPAGFRRGEMRAGVRLNVIETLRAAAPWQRLRQGENQGVGARIQVRRDDFRITRLKQRSQSTAIFVVDASGSSAFHRLAEAKGAVELLLAECYVRRDQVALVAFRGADAELLLPPTRSLVRAKRSLASLPGGGATPLATGIDAAAALADAVRRRGGTPLLILLTDGRANVARDGAKGRTQAEADALSAARLVRAAGHATLLVDTSAHPEPAARRLAAEMDAPYLPLPRADAAALSRIVRESRPTCP